MGAPAVLVSGGLLALLTKLLNSNQTAYSFPANHFLKDANHFEILDSVTVKFQPTSFGSSMMTYSINTNTKELILTPIPLCIEGCADKFKR